MHSNNSYEIVLVLKLELLIFDFKNNIFLKIIIRLDFFLQVQFIITVIFPLILYILINWLFILP